MEALFAIAILALFIIYVLFGRGKLANSLRNMFKSASDQAGEALADPIRDAKYTLEDAKREVAAFRAQIAELIKANNLLQIKADGFNQEADKFETIARAAGAEGNAADVREALQLKLTAEAKYKALSAEITKNEALEQTLKDQLVELEDRIEKGETDQITLGARVASAQIREKAAKSAANAGSGRGIEGLDALENAAASLEASADAYEELAQTSGKGKAASLDKKYGSGTLGVTDADISQYLKA